MDIQELFSPLIPTEFYNNTHNEPSNNFLMKNTKDNLSDVSDNFISEENDGNLSLQKGQTFETFKEVEKYLKQYCEQKGFEYRKRRIEYDNDNIVYKRTYKCTKATQYQPRKDKDPEKHRQRSSGSIGCQWHLNVTCPKSTEVIKIFTIVDEYNHPLNHNIKIHGVQFCQFSEEMKSDILELLTKKYPDIYIHHKNLYNAIQEVRRCKRIEEKDDAENMLQDLYNLQKEDPVHVLKILKEGATFIESGFLKVLFDKSLSAPGNKAQLLTTMFSDSADPANFTSQSQATNIQLTTLSLIFSIALYVSSSSWDTFMHHFYAEFGDMGDDDDTDDDVDDSSEDEIDTGDLDQMIIDLGKQTPNTASDKPPVLPDKKMAP
ncbi:hypothetical protein C1646_661384 [Rhizophagus diaphanus]|nr:hypothetical protein C1646_661384 [Rhizophagus diaphanus] [Rhizophagus sp. MUCL 43196]